MRALEARLRQPPEAVGQEEGPTLKACQSSIVLLPGTPQTLFPGLRQMRATLQAGVGQTLLSMWLRKALRLCGMLSPPPPTAGPALLSHRDNSPGEAHRAPSSEGSFGVPPHHHHGGSR